jgi:hypothetical protein
MRFKIIVFLFCLFISLRLDAGIEKKSISAPYNTELLSRVEDPQDSGFAVTYEYKTTADADAILKFYRNLFKDYKFQELKDVVPKESPNPVAIYVFEQPAEKITLFITKNSEDGSTLYYILTVSN